MAPHARGRWKGSRLCLAGTTGGFGSSAESISTIVKSRQVERREDLPLAANILPAEQSLATIKHLRMGAAILDH